LNALYGTVIFYDAVSSNALTVLVLRHRLALQNTGCSFYKKLPRKFKESYQQYFKRLWCTLNKLWDDFQLSVNKFLYFVKRVKGSKAQMCAINRRLKKIMNYAYMCAQCLTGWGNPNAHYDVYTASIQYPVL